MKPREDLGEPLPEKASQRLMYVTPLEREMLLTWVERVCDLAAELSDALCYVEHDLAVDIRNLRVYAKRVNLEAAHINALGMRIEESGHDVPPF